MRAHVHLPVIVNNGLSLILLISFILFLCLPGPETEQRASTMFGSKSGGFGTLSCKFLFKYIYNLYIINNIKL